MTSKLKSKPPVRKKPKEDETVGVDMKLLFEDREYRKLVCRYSIKHFAIYYFWHYITHEIPEFHDQMYSELQFPDFATLVFIMFRDSAKTALARVKVVHLICYAEEYRKHYVKWVGFDSKKAEKNVRSIANELQGNEEIIADFGQLYFEEGGVGSSKTVSKPKSIKEFVTENGVMVKADSTGVSSRGDTYGQYRPDFIVIDDIENEETKKSFVKTQSVITYLGELLTGISIDCQIIILGNYITKYGSIEWLRKKALKNPDMKVHWRALVENDCITWPGKYVWTDEEKRKENATIEDPKEKKQSIEAEIRKVGSVLFKQEKLLIPKEEGGKIVKREWFQRYSKSRLFQDGQKNWWYRFDGDAEATKASIVVTAVDPSVSQKQTSDERAIMTLARFDRKMKYGEETITKSFYLILKSNHGIWTMAEFARQLSLDRGAYSPRTIGVESNGVQAIFRELFNMYGISTTVLTPDTDKVRRLNRHVADIEFGLVMVPEDGSCDDFVDEVSDFTGESGKKDNQVDAFSYTMDMAKDETGGKFFGAVVGRKNSN